MKYNTSRPNKCSFMLSVVLLLRLQLS